MSVSLVKVTRLRITLEMPIALIMVPNPDANTIQPNMDEKIEDPRFFKSQIKKIPQNYSDWA
nr:hypothetical protein [Candidatus Sigynarchaeota archaeon]